MPDDELLPADDATILDEDILLRRVHPTKVVPDGAGGKRLSSSVFEDLPDRETGTRAMSVLVERRVIDVGATAEDILTDRYQEWGLVAVPARVVREQELVIVWSPSEQEGRFAEAHAHVFGKKRPSIQRKLLEECDQRVWPTVS